MTALGFDITYNNGYKPQQTSRKVPRSHNAKQPNRTKTMVRPANSIFQTHRRQNNGKHTRSMVPTTATGREFRRHICGRTTIRLELARDAIANIHPLFPVPPGDDLKLQLAVDASKIVIGGWFTTWIMAKRNMSDGRTHIYD